MHFNNRNASAIELVKEIEKSLCILCYEASNIFISLQDLANLKLMIPW